MVRQFLFLCCIYAMMMACGVKLVCGNLCTYEIDS